MAPTVTIKVAIDAINAAGAPHCFLSVTKWGHSAIVNTSGNGDCHIILRGGKEPNYSAKHVAEVKEGLNKAGLPAQVMIDFSHANSSKQFKKQMDVCADVCQQIAGGEKAIIGVMVESHLVEGNQSLESGSRWPTVRASPMPASAGKIPMLCYVNWRMQ